MVVYLRGVRLMYLREREFLISNLGDCSGWLNVDDIEDIIFNKKNSTRELL